MHVNHCVCHRKSFDVLKQVADEHDAKTIPELQCHVEFGKTCRMCHPYVRRMLKSGSTEFSAYDER